MKTSEQQKIKHFHRLFDKYEKKGGEGFTFAEWLAEIIVPKLEAKIEALQEDIKSIELNTNIYADQNAPCWRLASMRCAKLFVRVAIRLKMLKEAIRQAT